MCPGGVQDPDAGQDLRVAVYDVQVLAEGTQHEVDHRPGGPVGVGALHDIPGRRECGRAAGRCTGCVIAVQVREHHHIDILGGYFDGRQFIG